MTLHVLFFAVIVVVFSSIATLGSASHFRIVAGRSASAQEFPYQVSLEREGRAWCGGTIIHKKFVVTAAHCIKDLEDIKWFPEDLLRVRVGNDVSGVGGRVYPIEQVKPHEGYDPDAFHDTCDIALLKMVGPFQFNDRVQPIKPARSPPHEGEMAWVSGFGKQEIVRSSGQRHLKAVYLPVIELKHCQKLLAGVADDMICAGAPTGHKDACTGDSGGPMVVNKELVGAVAWGRGCGREGVPGVYTNVAYYHEWIADNMQNM